MSDDDSLFRYRRDSSDGLPGRRKTNSFPKSSNTKKVKFVKNGDKFFGGVQFTISPQRHRNLDALLNELTDIISLPYGVRSILTPQGGSRIETIDQLEHGKTYVCSSKHGLAKIDYNKVKSPSNWSTAIKPVQQDKLIKHHAYHPLRRTYTGDSIASVKSVASSMTSLPPPKVITVVRNGPPPREKNKVLVNQQTTPSWEYLLQSIVQLFDSKSNPVKKLFMMNGVEVSAKRLCSTINCDCLWENRSYRPFKSIEKCRFKYSECCSWPMVVATHTKFSHISQQFLTFLIIH